MTLEGIWCHQGWYHDIMTPPHALEVKMNAQGRLVVPLALRDQLQAVEGGTFVAYLDGDRLILERKGEARRRLLALGAALAPEAVSLADELIADRRRAEAAE